MKDFRVTEKIQIAMMEISFVDVEPNLDSEED